MAQNYRYLRSFRATRELIAKGTLGRVDLIACQYFRPQHQLGSNERLQHSVLFGMGVHHLDALRYVLEAEVTSVAAESFTQRPGSVAVRRLRFARCCRLKTQYARLTRTYQVSGHEFFERGQEFHAWFVGERATLHLLHRW